MKKKKRKAEYMCKQRAPKCSKSRASVPFFSAKHTTKKVKEKKPSFAEQKENKKEN